MELHVRPAVVAPGLGLPGGPALRPVAVDTWADQQSCMCVGGDLEESTTAAAGAQARLEVQPHQVVAVTVSAAAASVRAEERWQEWVAAVSANHDIARARSALDAAVAEQVYAWAVLHSARPGG